MRLGVLFAFVGVRARVVMAAALHWAAAAVPYRLPLQLLDLSVQAAVCRCARVRLLVLHRAVGRFWSLLELPAAVRQAA